MSGPVRARQQAGEAAVQSAYSAFIRHSQKCGPCRTEGADCETAARLRQAWRDARTAVAS
ncbi:hypothetical protein NW249_17615 [Streptomyces sp. OUCMDZ-4982]|uniref:hypothetical protein n=1 Tax=Streptomyces sp. OUCMDZ-4982 TaxID=2973090 RepID=UPI00215D39F1|nr:hypothetical protein [Streptomyces sp. OUCMDZ-4982]MCR8943945.1 hypothetical protein [Streptomyces sp. OUCMDZ-4982]